MRKTLRWPAAFVCSLLLAGCGPFVPTPADKAVCLTVDDLVELGLEMDIERSGESWFGLRSFGTSQLMYDYNEPRRRGGRQILFIQCQVLEQRTSMEAMVTYRTQIMASKAIAIGEMEERTRSEDDCTGADACVLIDFHLKGRAIGNHFVVRAGARVVSVTLLGYYFEDLREWRDIVASKVEAIERLE